MYTMSARATRTVLIDRKYLMLHIYYNEYFYIKNMDVDIQLRNVKIFF